MQIELLALKIASLPCFYWVFLVFIIVLEDIYKIHCLFCIGIEEQFSKGLAGVTKSKHIQFKIKKLYTISGR